MKTDSKTREGFHSIEILLKNKPEVIKKVIVPEAREDAFSFLFAISIHR